MRCDGISTQSFSGVTARYIVHPTVHPKVHLTVHPTVRFPWYSTINNGGHSVHMVEGPV